MRKPYLIAEVGINHNGDMDLAKKLIRQASVCEWDAVKFQKRTIETVYAGELDKPRESPWGDTQRDQKEGLEFSLAEMSELFSYAKTLGLDVSASAWDMQSLEEIECLNPDWHKVASPMLTNIDFVRNVASYGRHTYISTGMSDMFHITHAVNIFPQHNCSFTLLHCVSVYPCPEDKVNLSLIKTLKDRFGCDVGYSGHESGVLPSVVAMVMGASVVERHITLDRSMYGSDQAASLEKAGMIRIAEYARLIPLVIGDGVKRVLPQEEVNARKLRYFETELGEVANG